MVTQQQHPRHPRHDVKIKAVLSTLDFNPNINADVFIVDCSKVGFRIVSPLFFNPDARVKTQVEMIGGPFEIEGHILRCTEDGLQKVRFEKTYVITIEFSEIKDEDLEMLLALGKA